MVLCALLEMIPELRARSHYKTLLGVAPNRNKIKTRWQGWEDAEKYGMTTSKIGKVNLQVHLMIGLSFYFRYNISEYHIRYDISDITSQAYICINVVAYMYILIYRYRSLFFPSYLCFEHTPGSTQRLLPAQCSAACSKQCSGNHVVPGIKPSVPTCFLRASSF